MSPSRVFSLPIPLIALLAITPLADATCYVAAYGLVGEQDGWNACPGTASSAGGVEICCMPGSECGEDSLCHIPDSDDPGNNAWYQAGCTDPNYADSVCRNSCVDYTQTYIQWEDSTQLWMCCGDGACNGTVTDTTFQAVAPGDWKVITGSSSSSSVATSTTSRTNKPSSTETRKTQHLPSSADFKPTPTASKGADAVSASSNDKPAGLSSGVKAGIGVGITLAGLALIAALVAIFLFRRRQPRVILSPDKEVTEWTPPASAPSTEVSGESKWSELATNHSVYELPADHGGYFANKRY